MQAEKRESLGNTVVVNQNNKYLKVKRVFDLILSFILLIFLLPIFIAVAILIKLDDPKGKVFFRQSRIGKNEKKFDMYKFRSMYTDAEERLAELSHLNEIEGKMFKIKKDPRITRVGKHIREYSIDELPQIINVIKGNMSLIGPRPPLISEYKLYSEYDKNRLVVEPGITGLWQVSGRNSLSFSKMVELDIEYIKSMSLKNDLVIFFKTIVVVLKKENAY